MNEQDRVTGIRAICAAHGVDAERYIATGYEPEAVRHELEPDGSKSLVLIADFLGLDVEELNRLDQAERAERIRQAYRAKKPKGTPAPAD